MINEKELEFLCNKYRIKHKYFPGTNTILLTTIFDEWLIKYIDGNIKPYCLLHKNKLKHTKKFHTQRWVKNIRFAFDTINEHNKFYGFPIKIRKNTNIKTKGRNNIVKLHN